MKRKKKNIKHNQKAKNEISFHRNVVGCVGHVVFIQYLPQWQIFEFVACGCAAGLFAHYFMPYVALRLLISKTSTTFAFIHSFDPSNRKRDANYYEMYDTNYQVSSMMKKKYNRNFQLNIAF